MEKEVAESLRLIAVPPRQPSSVVVVSSTTVDIDIHVNVQEASATDNKVAQREIFINTFQHQYMDSGGPYHSQD